MKIVFFGTPPFAARTLEFLVEQGVEIAAVVTQPPRPKGRSKTPVPSAAAEMAKRHGLALFEPEKASVPDSLEVLEGYGADLFIVVAYGQLLKQPLLDIPPKGCINVHPSLLPKYRGAAPIQRAIMEGETKTGVTIMHVILKLDAGDIILQRSIPIDENATLPEVSDELSELSCKLLFEAVGQIEAGTAKRIAQDEALVTYAHKIEPEDCRIDWSRPAREIHNLVRAVTPRPGAWCLVEIRGKEHRLKILKSSLSEDGSFEPLEVQLEGKRKMTIKEFKSGFSQALYK